MSASGIAVKEKAVRPMTLQTIKTKAETALAEHLEAALSGSRKEDALVRLRREALGRFVALGLPHRRIEEWKYTDLRALMKEAPPEGASCDAKAVAAAEVEALGEAGVCALVFVDGKLATAPEGGVPQGVTIESFAVAAARDPKLLELALPETVDKGAESVIALNTALAADGAVVRVGEGVKLDRPLNLVFVASGTVAVRNMIALGAGASATVVETHVAPASAALHENTLTNVVLGEGAGLDHLVVASPRKGSVVLANTLADLAAKSTYKPFHMTSREGLMRHQLTLSFSGEHAVFDLGAAALVCGEGHADTTLVIDHKVPHCTSRELFKCVLDGEAKGVFQGKVIVRPGAQKTDGKQMAQALMLSPVAEFDSKPELEIYADDVICGHGSTSAELDEDMLFYCRSRGIPLAEARALLIESFIGEAIDKVENEGLRMKLMDAARAWLREGHI